LTVWLAYLLAQVIFPQRRAWVLGAVAFVASINVLHLSGGINNDIAAGLMSTATLLVCMRIVGKMAREARPTSDTNTTGCAIGVALLTKSLAALCDGRNRFDCRCTTTAVVKAFALANLMFWDWTLIAGCGICTIRLQYGEASGVGAMSRSGGRACAQPEYRLALSEMPYLWTSLWDVLVTPNSAYRLSVRSLVYPDSCQLAV